MRHFRFLLFMLVALLAAGSLLAQEQTASIQGTVLDVSGGALPGVTLEAVSDRGQRFSTVTDGQGRYRFPSVPPGMYAVTSSLAGMQQVTNKANVTLGSSPRVDFSMKLSQVSEVLTVTAESPVVDVTSSATATSIRSETFEKLPHGRDFSTVVTQAASANQENKAGGISIDGASGAENRYVMDGVDVTNPQTGVQGKTLVTDFVDEVQVKSAGYAAEFGGAIGGVINVITKTGTNEIKGSAGGYYNARSLGGGKERPLLQLNAAGSDFEQFQARKDRTRIIEPSLTIGGPIMRDRLWVFGAYEPTITNVSRSVNFSDSTANTFKQDFRRDNWLLNLSGNAGSRLLFKAAFNNSGYKTTNLLPGQNGRGLSSGSFYTLDDKFTNWTGSGYADFVASPSWFFSARGGRFYRNYASADVFAGEQVLFATGSNSKFPETPAAAVRPAGFATPSNFQDLFDKYTRDNLSLEGSWFTNLAGSHKFKAGVQIENLKNQVDRGNTNNLYRITWGTGTRFGGPAGKYGAVEVYRFETSGDISSKNTGLFVQDSWMTFNDRLTLNLGVRTEQERVPTYAAAGNDDTTGKLIPSTGKYAINFKYADKLAPRLGFAYDIRGDGRTKAYGSYGKFFDITKMELPRGSFGGDKWLDYQFQINDPDFTKWNCKNVTNNPNITPTCTGLTLTKDEDFPLGFVNLRHPSNLADNPTIDPNLKPMQSEEYTLGLQQQLSTRMAVGFRYVRKHLVRTIEDVGISRPGTEDFFIANPGEGIAQKILGDEFPSVPKAKRDYDGFELEFTSRFGQNWSAHASYLYSKLEGNYSGLANSDEALGGFGRTSPNVNRAFDSLFNLYTAAGAVSEGKLPTDRPHQLKAQVAYTFPFGTNVGVNQYYGTGTPVTTEMRFQGIPVFVFGRGNLGRLQALTQTDLNISHTLQLGRMGVQVGALVANLFDQKKATNIYNLYSSSSIRLRDLSKCGADLSVAGCGPSANTPRLGGSNANVEQTRGFFKGFDAQRQFDRQQALGLAVKDYRYGQPNSYQDPREIRVFAKLTF